MIQDRTLCDKNLSLRGTQQQIRMTQGIIHGLGVVVSPKEAKQMPMLLNVSVSPLHQAWCFPLICMYKMHLLNYIH